MSRALSSRSFLPVVMAMGLFAAGDSIAAPAEGLHIEVNGQTSIAVPSNTARSVYIKLRDVDDQHGRVASFHLKAYRRGALVGTHRLTVLEPQGFATKTFSRPFDRIDVSDAEGWVSGTVVKATFCEYKMVDGNTCAADNGAPTPSMRASLTSGGGEIAGDGTGGTDTGGGNSGGNTGGSGVENAGGGEKSGGEEAELEKQGENGNAFHGERTAISQQTGVAVQVGPMTVGSYLPYTPWLDQSKLSKSWRYMRWGKELIAHKDVKLDSNGMPIFPADHKDGDSRIMLGGAIWFGTGKEGSTDVAGTWQYKSARGTRIAPKVFDASEARRGNNEIRVVCVEAKPCRMQLSIESAEKDALPPTLIQLTDVTGRKTTDVVDHENGLVTRSTWRRAMYGYGVLRMMHASGATSNYSMPIRYDHFPTIEYASWANQGFFVPFRGQAKSKVKDPWADIVNDTGMQKIYSPIPARLRAAWEIGAVYHHNFPHLFMASKQDVDPALMGQWAIDLWARADVPEAKKLGLLNDYELQHVDAFGADILANQQYLVDNQIKLEVGNETWNFSWPYIYGNDYFSQKAAKFARQNGWEELPKAMPKQSVMTGYELTKSIARLRKKYPAVEWRGVLAVQTANVNSWRSTYRPAPATQNGYYNVPLNAMMVGYELFWQDYAQNEAEWSKMYTSKPVRPGDWLEVQGTTYFRVEAKRDDFKTHFAGIAPTELVRRTHDRTEWPKLRAEALAFFVDDNAERGTLNGALGLKTGTSSLYHLRRNFVALSEHAEAYGMQVASYEGGSHQSLGSYYFKKDIEQYPDLLAFWGAWHDSVENALIQAAVHDAAVAAGWVGLSDFRAFQKDKTDKYFFGARKSFRDVTPRWCEYARWMPENPPVPQGLENISDLQTPHEKCGRLIEYINQAKANGYYVGRNIPEASSFLN